MATKLSVRKYDHLAEQLMGRIQKEVKPFQDSSEQDQTDRIERAKKDLLYFCKTYLRHHFEDPWETGHVKIGRHLSIWNRILLVRGFRGVGKSTIISTGYALQANLFKLKEFIGYICDSDSQAAELALAVKIELEHNPRIRQDFGDMRGNKWEEDHFVTTKGVRNKCYSHRTFKRGSRFLTKRPGIVICEDFDNLENVRNPDQVKKRKSFITGELRPAMDRKNWQIIFVANRVARFDTGEMLDQIESVKTLDIWAEHKNGNPTHPKSFPKSVLDQMKKDMGTVDYNREMLGRIVSSPDDDFQEEWMSWLVRPEPKYMYITMALDPSVGSTSKNDFKAIIILGLTPDGRHRDVLWSWIRKTSINRMCSAFFELNRIWQPHRSAVESNVFQTLLKDKLQAMAPNEKGGYDLLAKLIQVNNQKNKNVRIMRLQPAMENGVLRFVRGAGDNERLAEQFLEYDSDITNNVDDGPDACEMANGELDKLTGHRSGANCEVM